jgi:hypothetical protein
VAPDFRDRCVCVINDQIVPREMWRHVRPKPCCIRRGKVIDVVVLFRLPLGGPSGGGGSSGGARKNPIATVASVAVLLAAAAVSGGALGPAGLGLLGAGFASATPGAAVLGAGIGLGGSVQTSALAPRTLT